MKQDQASAKGKGKNRKASSAQPAKPVRLAKEGIQKPVPPSAPDAPMKKDKLVRDSFTLPREDFELIALLKDRALDFKRPTKKSELLRAGLQVLARLDQAAFRTSLDSLRPLKAGRPKHKA